MGTEFVRLRRKNALWCFGRSILTGMAMTLLVAGGLMIFFKLTSTNGQMLLSAAVGAGVGIVSAVIRWLMLRRSDLRAAEQIDSEHNLRERVQTMIAFKDEDSVMLQLQRQDTEQKLQAVPKYGVSILSMIGHFLMVVVATAVLFCGLVLPARAEVEPPVYVEPDFDATAWQISSLEELIVHVQQSNMVEPAKSQTVEKLQQLRATLDGKVTISVFKGQILQTITDTYTFTDRVNSNDDVHDVIFPVEHDSTTLLAYIVGCLDNLEFTKDVEELGYKLGQDMALPTLGAFGAELETQLEQIPGTYVPANDYDENDRLYLAAKGLAEGLQEIAAMLDAGADALEVGNRLGEIVHEFKSGANLGLEQQTATKDECVYVVESLCRIFDIPASECPKDPDPTYTKDGEKEDDKVGSGGAGDGEMQYAGDEQIYDYKQDQHVSYTELVGEYYKSMIQAYLDGELPEEMKEFILKYFSQLYTG